MSYLLDTHALIWWWLGDEKLSRRVRALILNEQQTVWVSAISAFEIAQKVRLGRLPTMIEPLAQFEEAARNDDLRHLPLTHIHARQAGLMPDDHRDPFDRMIAAQALVEELTVITRDRQIAALGCKVFW